MTPNFAHKPARTSLLLTLCLTLTSSARVFPQAAGPAAAAATTTPRSAPLQPEGPYRISGHILNADSGAPLANAEVAILPVIDGLAQNPDDGQGSGRRRGRREGFDGPGRPPSGGPGGRRPRPTALDASTTSQDGAFLFDHLPAGKYSLQASHRGFISSSYQEHGFYSTAIVTGPGLPSENLALQLSAGASIRGSVLDASGDPIEEAQVTLFHLSDDGLANIRSYRSTNADDLGAYEFAHLPPGTYFVASKASVWYASNAQPQAGFFNRSPVETPGDPTASPQANPQAVPATNLDLVYPRAFYADTTDSSAAQPIPIRGGEHLRADLHLQAIPAIHLTYTLPPPAGDPAQPIYQPPPSLSQSVFGERDPAGETVSSREEHGRQVFSVSIAPGEYEADFGGHTVTLNAAADAVLDPGTGTPSVVLSGKIAPAPGATLPDQVGLALQPADHRGNTLFAPVAKDGTFHFDQVRPGTYQVTAQSAGQPLAVVDMAASGARIEGHQLLISTRAVSFAATLAPAIANITGLARSSAGQPESASGSSRAATAADTTASGAMIVLVPQHLQDDSLYRRDQSDSDGSFTLRNCAPGNYTAVAIRDGWDLDWARPEVIGRYLPGGEHVSVSITNPATIQLKQPLIVQPR